MAVSQKQIADELNLSIITVSRALRNHPYLAESTKSRVLQKARDLGYAKIHPQPAPPAVQRRAGVIFYESPNQKEDPFASGVKRSIFHTLQKECQRLQIETIIETPSAGEVPMLVKNRTINVAFIFGRYTPETVLQLRDIPTLAVSSFIPCAGLPRIVADNIRGMQAATEHLIGLGHRKILFVGLEDPHTSLFRERAEGYLIAMHARGLEPVIQFCPASAGSGFSLPLDRLAGFTGIVCASDSLAYSLQEQLEATGRRLPEDFSVVAFDNLANDYPLIRKITTYAPDWAMMGRMAADLLLSQPLDIQNKDIVVTVPGKLLIHESTRQIQNPA